MVKLKKFNKNLNIVKNLLLQLPLSQTSRYISGHHCDKEKCPPTDGRSRCSHHKGLYEVFVFMNLSATT